VVLVRGGLGVGMERGEGLGCLGCDVVSGGLSRRSRSFFRVHGGPRVFGEDGVVR
jgi:hypothetical protein